MSIVSRSGATETQDGDGPPSIYAPKSAGSRRPVAMTKEEMEVEQHKLGGIMLEAVDHLTGMSADEIDVVAERLMDGARETEHILRELSRRVRENGVFASERLANFVRAANKCAEVARSMQAALETRDETPAEQAPVRAQASAPDRKAAADQETKLSRPVDLNALGAQIETIGEVAPPTQPDDEADIAAPRPRGTEDSLLTANRPNARRPFLSVQTRKHAD